MKKQGDYGQELHSRILAEEETEESPFDQFKIWYADASASDIHLPDAMILATTGKDLQTSARLVLLKKADEHGFTFFSNYHSKKARQIDENPRGSLLFPWHDMERQVRIEGLIEKVSERESDEYFSSRPVGSRIGAWASPQSKIIPSRRYLDEIEANLKKEFEADSIPRPPHWGGYRLIPVLFEFWQGRESRLHDRLEYILEKDTWKIHRLAP
jgi:pyridoxamine 5'-phosphate oxidase